MAKYLVTSEDIHSEIVKFFKEVEEVIKATRDFVKTIPGVNDERYYSSNSSRFGGLHGVNFKKEVPEGWVKAKYGGYRPAAKNKEWYSKFYGLPTKDNSGCNKVLNYGNYMGPGCVLSMYPGISQTNGHYIVSVPEYALTAEKGSWVPPQGLIPITDEEVLKLKKRTGIPLQYDRTLLTNSVEEFTVLVESIDIETAIGIRNMLEQAFIAATILTNFEEKYEIISFNVASNLQRTV